MIPAPIINVNEWPIDQQVGFWASIILPLFSATAGSGFLGMAF